MTNLHGDGTKGKRLWIRSPNDTWIEVPTGKGQDEHVASVNVWNGSRWMTVAWAWWYLIQDGTTPASNIHQKIPSFEVRAPGVTYEGKLNPTDQVSYYNPTYITGQYDPYYPTIGTYQFADPNDGWVRLFHLAKRNDPNWRIIPIGFAALPWHIPNRTTDLLNYFKFFWPLGGQLYTSIDEFGIPTNQLLDPERYNTLDVGAQYSISRPADRGTVNFPTLDGEILRSSTLDVKAIRSQVRAVYPQQNVYYSGQYAHIDDMKLKRIYAAIYFQITGVANGPGVDINTFNGVTFRMYYKYQATDLQEFEITNDQPLFTWPGPVTVRAPVAHSSSADGAITLYEGAGPDVKYVNQYGDAWYFTWAQEIKTYEFLPTDDNITFWVEVHGLPQRNGIGITATGFDMLAQPYGFTLQYATDGHDVPEDKQNFIASS